MFKCIINKISHGNNTNDEETNVSDEKMQVIPYIEEITCGGVPKLESTMNHINFKNMWIHHNFSKKIETS